MSYACGAAAIERAAQILDVHRDAAAAGARLRVHGWPVGELIYWLGDQTV